VSRERVYTRLEKAWYYAGPVVLYLPSFSTGFLVWNKPQFYTFRVCV